MAGVVSNDITNTAAILAPSAPRPGEPWGVTLPFMRAAVRLAARTRRCRIVTPRAQMKIISRASSGFPETPRVRGGRAGDHGKMVPYVFRPPAMSRSTPWPGGRNLRVESPAATAKILPQPASGARDDPKRGQLRYDRTGNSG